MTAQPKGPRASPFHRALSARRLGLSVVAICGLAALLRVGVMGRQGLWADEVFSLAMATGHSLEHPAARADPALGDFVESARPVPPSEYRHYMEHGRPAAGPHRVVRAVLLSDTSPPLYYLVLNAWTRWAGTSDRALRGFSVLWSLLCIPLLASLARRLGGRRAVLPACVFFACAPASVYYATEGRMYAMLVALVLATAWSTLRLHQRGARPADVLLWVCASAAGLLTHYFFAFVWGSLCLWLLMHPHRFGPRPLAVAAGLTGLAVSPWYAVLPRSIAAWRVTKGWLETAPAGFDPLGAQLGLVWSYFTVVGEWYASARVDRLLMALLLVAVGAGLWRAGRRAVGPRWQVLWLWVGASGVGLLAFDVWQGTYTRALPRYALAGMPAAFLLVSAALARLPATARMLVVVAVSALWVPGLRRVFANESRAGSPIREVAADVSERSRASDVVLVQSIPSGVLAVARYLDGPAEMAPWVGQLGRRRVPEDVQALTAGRRVFLVEVHDMGEPAVVEAYLRERAEAVGETHRQTAHVVEFSPREGRGRSGAAAADFPSVPIAATR